MNDSTFYLMAVPGAFIILNVALYFWNPKVKWKYLGGSNGQNTLFSVAIDPNAKHKLAVLAQEIAERRWKIARGFGIPGLQLILQRIPALNRSMELWGHEVEVQAAILMYPTALEDWKRISEARTMARSDKYEFKSAGWDADRIEEEMLKLRNDAKKWVLKNMKTLEDSHG